MQTLLLGRDVDQTSMTLSEVRLCRLCHVDDFVPLLVKYARTHYAHPSCIADGWWIDRIRKLMTFPLRRVLASAQEQGFTELVTNIELELAERRAA